jgi:hypothetical protein
MARSSKEGRRPGEGMARSARAGADELGRDEICKGRSRRARSEQGPMISARGGHDNLGQVRVRASSDTCVHRRDQASSGRCVHGGDWGRQVRDDMWDPLA